ncbi:sulfotransferase domain-containing protein [Haliea sp. E17]|uniref:sulfotransferase domain-containing protein n=1 Tax=Haliea sp. E17 TaxID=3401576 RepID=UPI003AB05DB4
MAFHIGYHKTATSWLQKAYFPSHPEVDLLCNSSAPWNDPFLHYLISTPELKFDAHEAQRRLYSQQSSDSSDRKRKIGLVSAERLSGFPLSGGFDSVHIAHRIHKVAADAKIIIVVREQSDMISSVYKQMVGEGFSGTLEQMLNRPSWKTAGFNLAFYEFDLLVRLYLDLFGNDQVLVLSYESFREAPDKFVSQLCDFLEISKLSPPAENKIVNQGMSTASMRMIRRLNPIRETEFNPYPAIKLPPGIFEFIYKSHRAIDRRQLQLMSDDLRSELQDYYRSSNIQLHQLTGIKLTDRATSDPENI